MTSVFTLNFAQSNLPKFSLFSNKLTIIWHSDSRASRCVTNDDDHLSFYRWSGSKYERRKSKWWGCDGFHLLAIPPLFLFFFCWLVFIFLKDTDPVELTESNQLKKLMHSQPRGRERRCDASFVTESIVGHVPSSSSGPDVWKWNCFNPLTAWTKSSRVSSGERGNISLWKRQEKVESYFILFHYRRYDVTGCVFARESARSCD